MSLTKLSLTWVSQSWNHAQRVGFLWFPVLSGCSESRMLTTLSRDLLGGMAFYVSATGLTQPSMMDVRALLDEELASPHSLPRRLCSLGHPRLNTLNARLKDGRCGLFGDPIPMLDLHITAPRAKDLSSRWGDVLPTTD
jgi:hypothetical protein